MQALHKSYVEVETFDGNSLLVLYKKNRVEILRKHVCLACNKDVTYCHHDDGRGAVCHHVNSN